MNEPRYEPSPEELGLTPESSDVSEVRPDEWLTSPEAVAIYLDEALGSGDPRFIAHCLGEIAQVTGASLPENLMSDLASLLDMLRGMNVQLRAREAEYAEPAVA